MGSSAGNGEEERIYGYVDMFKAMGDPRPNHIYMLNTDNVKIGREHRCDIRLHSLRVSRLQCEVKFTETGERLRAVLQNLSSKATTKYNGQGLPQRGEVELKDGDRFQLHDIELRYRVFDPSNPPDPSQKSPPLIRITKDNAQTPQRESSSGKKTPKSEKSHTSRVSGRGSRLNKSLDGSSELSSTKRRKSSEIDMRRVVLQKTFRESCKGRIRFQPITEDLSAPPPSSNDSNGLEDTSQNETSVDPDTGNDVQAENVEEIGAGSSINSMETQIMESSDLIVLSPEPEPSVDAPKDTSDLLVFEDIERQMFALHHGNTDGDEVVVPAEVDAQVVIEDTPEEFTCQPPVSENLSSSSICSDGVGNTSTTSVETVEVTPSGQALSDTVTSESVESTLKTPLTTSASGSTPIKSATPNASLIEGTPNMAKTFCTAFDDYDQEDVSFDTTSKTNNDEFFDAEENNMETSDIFEASSKETQLEEIETQDVDSDIEVLSNEGEEIDSLPEQIAEPLVTSIIVGKDRSLNADVADDDIQLDLTESSSALEHVPLPESINLDDSLSDSIAGDKSDERLLAETDPMHLPAIDSDEIIDLDQDGNYSGNVTVEAGSCFAESSNTSLNLNKTPNTTTTHEEDSEKQQSSPLKRLETQTDVAEIDLGDNEGCNKESVLTPVVDVLDSVPENEIVISTNDQESSNIGMANCENEEILNTDQDVDSNLPQALTSEKTDEEEKGNGDAFSTKNVEDKTEDVLQTPSRTLRLRRAPSNDAVPLSTPRRGRKGQLGEEPNSLIKRNAMTTPRRMATRRGQSVNSDGTEVSKTPGNTPRVTRSRARSVDVQIIEAEVVDIVDEEEESMPVVTEEAIGATDDGNVEENEDEATKRDAVLVDTSVHASAKDDSTYFYPTCDSDVEEDLISVASAESNVQQLVMSEEKKDSEDLEPTDVDDKENMNISVNVDSNTEKEKTLQRNVISEIASPKPVLKECSVVLQRIIIHLDPFLSDDEENIGKQQSTEPAGDHGKGQEEALNKSNLPVSTPKVDVSTPTAKAGSRISTADFETPEVEKVSIDEVTTSNAEDDSRKTSSPTSRKVSPSTPVATEKNETDGTSPTKNVDIQIEENEATKDGETISEADAEAVSPKHVRQSKLVNVASKSPSARGSSVPLSQIVTEESKDNEIRDETAMKVYDKVMEDDRAEEPDADIVEMEDVAKPVDDDIAEAENDIEVDEGDAVESDQDDIVVVESDDGDVESDKAEDVESDKDEDVESDKDDDVKSVKNDVESDTDSVEAHDVILKHKKHDEIEGSDSSEKASFQEEPHVRSSSTPKEKGARESLKSVSSTPSLSKSRASISTPTSMNPFIVLERIVVPNELSPTSQRSDTKISPSAQSSPKSAVRKSVKPVPIETADSDIEESTTHKIPIAQKPAVQTPVETTKRTRGARKERSVTESDSDSDNVEIIGSTSPITTSAKTFGKRETVKIGRLLKAVEIKDIKKNGTVSNTVEVEAKGLESPIAEGTKNKNVSGTKQRQAVSKQQQDSSSDTDDDDSKKHKTPVRSGVKSKRSQNTKDIDDEVFAKPQSRSTRTKPGRPKVATKLQDSDSSSDVSTRSTRSRRIKEPELVELDSEEESDNSQSSQKSQRARPKGSKKVIRKVSDDNIKSDKNSSSDKTVDDKDDGSDEEKVTTRRGRPKKIVHTSVEVATPGSRGRQRQLRNQSEDDNADGKISQSGIGNDNQRLNGEEKKNALHTSTISSKKRTNNKIIKDVVTVQPSSTNAIESSYSGDVGTPSTSSKKSPAKTRTRAQRNGEPFVSIVPLEDTPNSVITPGNKRPVAQPPASNDIEDNKSGRQIGKRRKDKTGKSKPADLQVVDDREESKNEKGKSDVPVVTKKPTNKPAERTRRNKNNDDGSSNISGDEPSETRKDTQLSPRKQPKRGITRRNQPEPEEVIDLDDDDIVVNPHVESSEVGEKKAVRNNKRGRKVIEEGIVEEVPKSKRGRHNKIEVQSTKGLLKNKKTRRSDTDDEAEKSEEEEDEKVEPKRTGRSHRSGSQDSHSEKETLEVKQTHRTRRNKDTEEVCKVTDDTSSKTRTKRTANPTSRHQKIEPSSSTLDKVVIRSKKLKGKDVPAKIVTPDSSSEEEKPDSSDDEEIQETKKPAAKQVRPASKVVETASSKTRSTRRKGGKETAQPAVEDIPEKSDPPTKRGLKRQGKEGKKKKEERESESESEAPSVTPSITSSSGKGRTRKPVDQKTNTTGSTKNKKAPRVVLQLPESKPEIVDLSSDEEVESKKPTKRARLVTKGGQKSDATAKSSSTRTTRKRKI